MLGALFANAAAAHAGDRCKCCGELPQRFPCGPFYGLYPTCWRQFRGQAVCGHLARPPLAQEKPLKDEEPKPPAESKPSKQEETVPPEENPAGADAEGDLTAQPPTEAPDQAPVKTEEKPPTTSPNEVPDLPTDEPQAPQSSRRPVRPQVPTSEIDWDARAQAVVTDEGARIVRATRSNPLRPTSPIVQPAQFVTPAARTVAPGSELRRIDQPRLESLPPVEN